MLQAFPVADLSDEIQPLPTERPAPLLPFLPGDTMEYSGVFPPFPRTEKEREFQTMASSERATVRPPVQLLCLDGYSVLSEKRSVSAAAPLENNPCGQACGQSVNHPAEPLLAVQSHGDKRRRVILLPG